MSKLLNFYEDEIHDKVREILSGCETVRADKLGLDRRCGMLYIDEDSIVVHISDDQRLQYYGGFEYIDKCDRVQVGDYVVYLDSSDRVADCLDCYNNPEEEVA